MVVVYSSLACVTSVLVRRVFRILAASELEREQKVDQAGGGGATKGTLDVRLHVAKVYLGQHFQ